MSKELTIKVHAVAVDGLPDMDDDSMTGRVAFIWDGQVIPGWPLREEEPDVTVWEGDTDVTGNCREFHGVTHWIEFPVPMWKLADD